MGRFVGPVFYFMTGRVEITDLAFGGKGVGRIDGKVVFVPFSAPGDLCEVEITSDKKGFFEGAIKKIERPSPDRVEPPCPVFGRCGGCSLQHIEYASQVKWKQKILEETLKRIGKIDGIPFEPPLPSANPFNYRSRARFQADGAKAGFFGERTHNIVEVASCPLLEGLINETYADIREKILKPGGHPIHGFEIGLSETDSKTVAVFHCVPGHRFDWEKAVKPVRHLKGYEVWTSHDKRRKGRRVGSCGDTRLLFSSGGIGFSAGVSQFTQVNRAQNEALISRLLEYGAFTGLDKVLDLYCGAGNLTLPAARRSGKAVGVESNADAVEEARENAAANGVNNAEFHGSDARLWVKRNLKDIEKEEFDVLILDPPRGGEPEIEKAFSAVKPGRVLYVSCSPPTLARDISALARLGCKVNKAALIDMFPQTFHIETVLSLELA